MEKTTSEMNPLQFAFTTDAHLNQLIYGYVTCCSNSDHILLIKSYQTIFFFKKNIYINDSNLENLPFQRQRNIKNTRVHFLSETIKEGNFTSLLGFTLRKYHLYLATDLI